MDGLDLDKQANFNCSLGQINGTILKYVTNNKLLPKITC